MKFLKRFNAILLMLLILGVGFSVQAQTAMNNQMAKTIIKRLEMNSDKFRDHLDVEFVNVRNEDMRESLIQAQVAAFEVVTDRLSDRVEDNEVIPSDVEGVLSRALAIERALHNAKVSTDAMADWARIRADLDALAKAYNVAWVWTLDANPYWKNPAAAERIVDDLEDSTDQFRRSFDYALDTSRLNGTAMEDNANKLADAFENQVDRWEDLADSERLSQANMDLLLQRALALEAFMRANNLTMGRAYRDWAQVKINLDDLAMRANINWRWNATPVAAK